MHVPDAQNGADASQSVADVHASAMHWLPRHSNPSAHGLVVLRPTAAQSDADVQHTAGLVFVQADAPSHITTTKDRHDMVRFSSIMRPLSTATAKGCLEPGDVDLHGP
jgi:hypothetical protein